MKKLLGIALALCTLGFVVPTQAETTTSINENTTVAANAVPQWQRDRREHRRWDRRYDRRWNRRYNERYNQRYNTRAVTRSRIVRYGRGLYRETYVVRYFPNGQVGRQLVSRTRIG